MHILNIIPNLLKSNVYFLMLPHNQLLCVFYTQFHFTETVAYDGYFVEIALGLIIKI